MHIMIFPVFYKINVFQLIINVVKNKNKEYIPPKAQFL